MSHAKLIFACASLSAGLLSSSLASAHIALLEPPPRANGRSEGNLKSGPCGQNANGRTDEVTSFEPGATIEVRWDEYINHESYFRVAINMDGDDFAERPAQDIPRVGDDPMAEEVAIDTGQLLAVIEDDSNGGEQSARVTLPDEECDNCTLQLLQFMYNREDTYYYQCADIAIRASGGGEPVADSGTGRVDDEVTSSGGGGDGGCALGGVSSSRSSDLAWLALLGVGLLVRRWHGE